MSSILFEMLGEIFAPLETLLASGGDTRLRLDPTSQLNGYGCRPYPRPEAITFASSTATSISERAYAAAETARYELIRAGLRHGLESAFEDRVEQSRSELKGLLGLDKGVEIVFSPSGTDSELQALFVARTILGTPMVSVIAASDETGSGVAYASCGKHFNTLTAQGAAVEKGNPISGLAEDVASVSIPLRDDVGRALSLVDIDAAVLHAVSQAVTAGGRVLLHAMDHSKLGCRCPSVDCLRAIRARWGNTVQVVVDACQMRLGRSRLRWHLDQGHMVLITGSKFFTGPPFSGALLVPAEIAVRMAEAGGLSLGLRDYASRSDWPASWHGVRATLQERLNLGQMLRWIAALEEMRAYFAVPPSFRKFALSRFGTVVSRMIAAEENLELLPDYERSPAESGDHADEEEMAVRTIFAFLPRRGGRCLSLADCTMLYRALNEDVSALLPLSASAMDRRLAARLCHVGQPVSVPDPAGGYAAALRISAGARVISENWSKAGEGAALQNLQREFEEVLAILNKVSLLLRHFDALVDASETKNEAAA